MTELTKIFKGTEIHVDIIDDENMYFDISGIAKANGKNITDWKNSKRTLELIELLENPNGSDLIKTKKEFGKLETTSIHNSLFVSFARFISVEFEIASNKIIMDIILGEKQLCDKKYELQEKQLLLKDNMIKKLASSVYAKPRQNNYETITHIKRENGINMSVHDINIALVACGWLEIEEVVVSQFKSTSTNVIMDKQVPLIHEESLLKLLDAMGVEREKGYFDARPTLFDGK